MQDKKRVHLKEEDGFQSGNSGNKTLGDIIAARYSRRSFVKGSLAVAAGAGLTNLWGCSPSETSIVEVSDAAFSASFNFQEILHGIDDTHHVAADHQADVLIRWGDPIHPDTPEFDPLNQTAELQEKQFGFNNDYIGYWELEPLEGQQVRALLCVNHESPNSRMMFSGIGENYKEEVTAEQVEIEKAAVGCSVVEVYKAGGLWQLNRESPYNRRITARSTQMEVGGPAAGHPRMQTNADPSGKLVIGTMNNCAGGMTPWGTYLTCEENFDEPFSGEVLEGNPEAENYRRYGIPEGKYPWGKFDPRFNIESEPNEPNRFGWVVEIDPLKPESMPVKRTALGRFKHEGAENAMAPDGRLVVYMGDDEGFDYLYKFVSRDKVDLVNRENNSDLLDHGILYVARFNEDGSLDWLPVVHGQGPLIEANGFDSQATVLIETRRAADLLEATPMDRPEDVVPNSKTGKVYVMLTNNTRRKPENTDAANPRGANPFGHIIEITEPNGDFAAEKSSWDIFIKAGDPQNPEIEAQWNSHTSENGWFASPDNGVIDPEGRLWVSTDQGAKTSISGTNDGLWAVETEGSLRGTGRMFFRCPTGAEVCGPEFSNNGEALFLAVQHPGQADDGADIWATTDFDHPLNRWPDFDENLPPRPSIMVVKRKDGGRVG